MTDIPADWVSKKIDKFVIVNKRLGKGAFGTVYRGYFEDNESKLIAVKQIAIKNIAHSEKMIKLIKREISLLNKLDSKYIVKLYDVSRTPNNLYMFLEYCMDGDLKEYLKKKQGNCLSEPEAIKFFKHIVEGFKELHKHSMIHRDIKPANILLHQGRAKISDFGFSRQLDTDAQQELTLLGSPLYMSPQILEGGKFSSKCDVWSVGFMFYEMLYGRTPWIGTSQLNLLSNIQSRPLSFPDEPIRGEPVKNLIRKMLRLREEDRVSWQEVFEDQLIVGDRKMLEESIRLIQFTMNELDRSIIENGAYVQTNLIVDYLRKVDEQEEDEDEQNTTANETMATNTTATTAATEPDHDSKAPHLHSHPQQMQSNPEDEVDESPKPYSTQKQPQSHNSLQQLLTEGPTQEDDKATLVVKAQISSERMRKNVLKVNEYVLYERNVSFFYNFVIQKIIRAYNTGVLVIPSDLYFRVIFAICKFQNINLEKVTMMLKSPTSQFAPQLWKSFQRSIEFVKTQKIIAMDNFHSRKFFTELTKKTKEVITHTLKKETVPEMHKDILRRFEETMPITADHRFVSDPAFKQVYHVTLQEMLMVLKSIVSTTGKLEVLCIVHCLIICQNPFNEFNNTDFDFNKFYETLDHCEIEKMRKQVTLRLTEEKKQQQQQQQHKNNEKISS